jgi:hypothetical protein
MTYKCFINRFSHNKRSDREVILLLVKVCNKIQVKLKIGRHKENNVVRLSKIRKAKIN